MIHYFEIVVFLSHEINKSLPHTVEIFLLNDREIGWGGV